jgi:hemolysin D
LIELDPRFNAAEGEHLRNDLVAAELDIARVNAALADVVNPIAAFQPPPDANPSLVDSERKFLISQLAEHAAKMAALKDQQREKKAEVDGTAASIVKLQSVEAVEQQILDMRQQLADRGYVSKLLLLQTLQAVTETKSDLVITKDKLNEANAALSAMTDTIFQAEGEYRRGLFAELDEAKRKAGGLQHDLEKIAERAKLERLTAPVSGVVQQLAVHTEGGVVTPAERLMLIVPDNAKLEVEAMLTNRDVGFVHPGQAAQVKVDTFDFTRYGLLHGTVSRVSPDAVIGDSGDMKPADGGPGSNAPQPQALNYAVRIAVDRTHMEVGDTSVDLRPGMAVTVDIKTGRRSVISYLLSPLLRRGHQSLHER